MFNFKKKVFQKSINKNIKRVCLSTAKEKELQSTTVSQTIPADKDPGKLCSSWKLYCRPKCSMNLVKAAGQAECAELFIHK